MARTSPEEKATADKMAQRRRRAAKRLVAAFSGDDTPLSPTRSRLASEGVQLRSADDALRLGEDAVRIAIEDSAIDSATVARILLAGAAACARTTELATIEARITALETAKIGRAV